MRRLLFLLLAALVLTGCRPKETDWTVTLAADDARPYGAQLLARSLPAWFGEAAIEKLPAGHRYDALESTLNDRPGERALLVLFGLDFFISDAEWESLKAWVAAGNDVVVFAAAWDAKILDRLHLRSNRIPPDEEDPLNAFSAAILQRQAVWLNAAPSRQFTYRGHNLLGSFLIGDTTDFITDLDGYKIVGPQLIGASNRGPTCVRYPIGDGWLTLHAAPLVLSNYFLLQGANRQYLDGLWQATASAAYGAVYWQDYYKRRGEKASWGALWRYPATRWALLLALLTALLYVVFEAKRRQRIIPIVKPPENTSVLFVETVGRLYYSRSDHQNLAEKMVQQALETIRTKYRLTTDVLDASLAKVLAQKASLPETAAAEAILLCEAVRSGALRVTETDLYHLHQTLRPLLR